MITNVDFKTLFKASNSLKLVEQNPINLKLKMIFCFFFCHYIFVVISLYFRGFQMRWTNSIHRVASCLWSWATYSLRQNSKAEATAPCFGAHWAPVCIPISSDISCLPNSSMLYSFSWIVIYCILNKFIYLLI